MMNLYRPIDRSRRERRRLLATTVLVVLLIAIDFVSGGVLRHVTKAGGSLLWRIGTSITGTIAGSGFFSTRAMLEDRIRSLTEEVERLRSESAAYVVMRDEHEHLQQLVHLVELSPGITAPVQSSMRASPYGTFLIGAGREDGASVGDIVLAPEGFVIGTIVDVGAKQASVAMVFAPQSSLDALVAGARVKVDGRGSGNAHLRMPHGLEVRSGDIVHAPQYKGMAIGIVGGIASSSSAYSDVYVGLPFSLDSVRYVYVAPK